MLTPAALIASTGLVCAQALPGTGSTSLIERQIFDTSLYGAQPLGNQPYGGLPAWPRPIVEGEPSETEPTLRPSVGDPPAEPIPNWLISPYASLREAFTDNVRLTPNGSSDFITTATPGLTVRGKTRRLQATLDGSVSYDKYARSSDLDGYRYNFYGNGLGEIVDDYLFLDARSSISAEPISTSAGISGIDRTLPGNQVQIINNSVSPYLAHDFGTAASAELRYRLSTVTYSDSNTESQVRVPTATGNRQVDLNDTVTNQVSGFLRAGPRFTVFRWAADGSASKTEYSNDRTIERTSATLTGEYAVMRELAVLAKIGEDSFDDSAALVRSDEVHPSWRLGGRLTPGPRTDLFVEAGSRFGGPYWSGELRYRISGALTLTASHDETVNTQQELSSDALARLIRDERGRLVDPLTGAVANPNATPFNFTSQSFTMERSRVSLNGVYGRNSFDLSTEYSEREIGATALDQSGQSKQEILLLTGTYGRQLTRVSDANILVSVGMTDDTLATGSYDIFQAGAGYNYDFSNSLRGSLAYRFYSLSNQTGTSYEENAIIASIRKNF